ncbi:MAG: polyribonucleotide nucleotidyltransferase [Candidatus Delongbacteria bacterium]|nr:polyribonucleotide nucleotidyltransferase [Candidatus Delongbacteria bacterium]MBN2835265.1 polyribonucleotide nucleotidyltransferase [Candidatus Delongbacteria bacterium]
MFFSKSFNLGGRELILESGKMAKQANGSCVLKYGDNLMLVTVCGKREPVVGSDFFPLTVEYVEKLYASGKIPGGFIKRETKPSNDEVLSARIIDRPIRPLFPDGFKNEVQVIANVFSSDGVTKMDSLGIIAASMAINLSDIPFSGPVAGLRIGRLNGEFIVNPETDQMKECDIELVISGGKGFISMVEGEAKEVSEKEMLEAVEFGQKIIDELCEFQEAIIKEFGKEKFEYSVPKIDEELKEKVIEFTGSELKEIVRIIKKEERNDAKRELYEKADAHFAELLGDDFDANKEMIHDVIHDLEKEYVRTNIIKNKLRIDGRKPDEIRQITCELDILARSHGSSLFTRGETQSLGICTLGSEMDSQKVDSIYGEENRKFYLHYNFPPFSVGEVKRLGSVSRREIGHGHLAERSFYSVLPETKEFPYTIRVVSEILESNGSSSMATVCSNTLAMLAAGVPLKAPVSGIAMGLIKEGDEFEVLSDILGDEDHLGDMDFKVTGTENGICAYQMDIKIKGISIEIMKKALEQANAGRKHILGIMNQTISTHREEMSPYAPRIISYKIDPDEIKVVIGSGGKTIQEITKLYNVKIDIDDTGLVKIMSADEGGEKCKIHIMGLLKKLEPGKVYNSKVKSIKPFGAFVELLPNNEALLHISEVALERVEKVEDVLNIGDMVEVLYHGKDKEGRHKITRRELLKEAKKEEAAKVEPETPQEEITDSDFLD